MSSSTSGHSDPDPRSELYALIEAASLSHPVGRQKVEALLEIQEKLRSDQERLAQWLSAKRINKTEFIAKLDTVMKETARAGEKILGFDDFHKVFGEFSVQSVVDAKSFVGAGDDGGFFVR
jgi:hypothetical protein